MLAKTRRLLKDNSGVAMIYSLVIGIVVAIFAVMLLMVTYSLYASSSRQTGQTQCRIMADSYAECLKGEISDTESTVYKYISEQLKAGNKDIELDIVQDNYTLYTHLTAKINTSDYSSDDDLSDETDDNDPQIVNPTQAVSPIVTPSVSPAAIPVLSGNKVELIATIKCNKGGVGGIGEQSYSITQRYSIIVE